MFRVCPKYFQKTKANGCGDEGKLINYDADDDEEDTDDDDGDDDDGQRNH